MLIELKAVCKEYRQGKAAVPVLRDINMQVEQGEYLAIMGPSGSGKTTLMNILGLLDTPTSGEYLLEGRDNTNLPDAETARIRNQSIGFVFQTFHLLPRKSALDNVMLPLIYGGVGRRERRERAAEALERVGLADRMDFKPTQLSGGQCQRVAIARAICTKPKLLLADEPTGALDSKSTDELLRLFGEVNCGGQTILMVTHSVKAASCAGRVLFIRDGEVFHQLYRGDATNELFYQRISETLTMLAGGGEAR